jgi:glycosyltransferase involved in cell wall biosynthesis
MMKNTENGPMWSVMIPTYNCAGYLRETLASVLQQDPGESWMQIEVIDDCSTDDPEAVVNELGRGRVKFYRQEKNGGHIKNFKTALEKAEGKIIHLLHGDDMVLPGFYKEMEKMYETYPEIKACFCRHFFIDSDSDIKLVSRLHKKSNGVFEEFFELMVMDQYVQTPSITVKREVYEQLGTFNPTLSWTEDWEMWVRIGKEFPVGYIKSPLAAYRVHESSSTGTKSITGENVNDLIRIKEILLGYAKSRGLTEKVEASLNRIILDYSIKNYHAALKIDKKSAQKHLKKMIDYSPKFRDRIIYKLSYFKNSLF